MPPLPTFTIGKWFFYGRISLSLSFLFLFLVNESTIKTMDETKEYCSRNGMEMPERDTATARGTPVYKAPVRRHYRNLLEEFLVVFSSGCCCCCCINSLFSFIMSGSDGLCAGFSLTHYPIVELRVCCVRLCAPISWIFIVPSSSPSIWWRGSGGCQRSSVVLVLVGSCDGRPVDSENWNLIVILYSILISGGQSTNWYVWCNTKLDDEGEDSKVRVLLLLTNLSSRESAVIINKSSSTIFEFPRRVPSRPHRFIYIIIITFVKRISKDKK